MASEFSGTGITLPTMKASATTSRYTCYVYRYTVCIIIMSHQRRQFNQSIQLQHLHVDLSAFSAFHISTLKQKGAYGSLVVIARKFY